MGKNAYGCHAEDASPGHTSMARSANACCKRLQGHSALGKARAITSVATIGGSIA
jgi:hypothetical protein